MKKNTKILCLATLSLFASWHFGWLLGFHFLDFQASVFYYAVTLVTSFLTILIVWRMYRSSSSSKRLSENRT